MAEVTGLPDALRALDGLRDQTAAATSAGHEQLSSAQAAEIRADAPMPPGESGQATGHLASTIRVERNSAYQTDVVVGDDSTYYLGFYEFGTSRQPARPFVRPAASRAEARHLSTMLAEARKRIR